MPCSCGSVTCPCRGNCFCTDRYCLCLACNGIRGNRCGLCGLPTYHQSLMLLGETVQRCCSCFISASEVTEYGNGTHYDDKGANSRPVSRNTCVRRKNAPLPTISLDSLSTNIQHPSSNAPRSLPTQEPSNILDISDCRATGYRQGDQTEKPLPIVPIEETHLITEQTGAEGHGESTENQCLQETATASGSQDFVPNTAEAQFGGPQSTKSGSYSTYTAKLSSGFQNLQFSSTTDPESPTRTDPESPTRRGKRQNRRRKSKKCPRDSTKPKMVSTSESDSPQTSLPRKPFESKMHSSSSAACKSKTVPPSGLIQVQIRPEFNPPFLSPFKQFVGSTTRAPFKRPSEGIRLPPFNIPLEDIPLPPGDPPPKISWEDIRLPAPPVTQFFRSSRIPSSTTSREFGKTTSKLPFGKIFFRGKSKQPSIAFFPPQSDHHFRDESNIKNWIDSTEAARPHSPILHEVEDVETFYDHSNVNLESVYGETSAGGQSDTELTEPRVRKISTDDSNPYPLSTDNESNSNQGYDSSGVSGETTVSTNLDSSNLSDSSPEEANEHAAIEPNVEAANSHSSNSPENMSPDEYDNYIEYPISNGYRYC